MEEDVRLSSETSDGTILAEIALAYVDNPTIGKGLCSCVCINDEQCCGCPSQ